MVIVDTSVWIKAFRNDSSVEKDELDRLLAADEVGMVGMVYMELLRGGRSNEEFTRLSVRLGSLPFIDANKDVWTRAARILFDLDRQGMAIPTQDALIAAHAIETSSPLYTTDPHFERVPALQLHEPEAR